MKQIKTLEAVAVLLLFSINAFAQNIAYNLRPSDFQLFPRNNFNKAEVIFSGKVLNTAYTKISCIGYKNNQIFSYLLQDLIFSEDTATFYFKNTITAELSEYDFKIYLKQESDSLRDLYVKNIVSGDCFLITGQSNAHPLVSQESGFGNEFCRSFGRNTDSEPYNPADTLWGIANGGYRYKPFSSGAWGICLQQFLTETFQVPNCIINSGVGGSSIYSHLPKNNHYDLSSNYGKLLYRAEKAGIKDAVRAIFWHQGEADGADSWKNYRSNFRNLRNAWLADYQGIEKMFIFQVRPGCTKGQSQDKLREVQRNLALEFDDVEIMTTVGIQGHETDNCHYTAAGYHQMAQWIFPLVATEIYHLKMPYEVRPPNVRKAYFDSQTLTRLVIEFDQDICFDYATAEILRNHIYINGEYGYIENITYEGRNVIIYLTEACKAKNISYIPARFYNNSTEIYEGPFIFSAVNNTGALTFNEVNIYFNELDLIQIYPIPANNEIDYFVHNCNKYKVRIFDIYGNPIDFDLQQISENNNRIILKNNSKGGFYILLKTWKKYE